MQAACRLPTVGGGLPSRAACRRSSWSSALQQLDLKPSVTGLSRLGGSASAMAPRAMLLRLAEALDRLRHGGVFELASWSARPRDSGRDFPLHRRATILPERDTIGPACRRSAPSTGSIGLFVQVLLTRPVSRRAPPRARWRMDRTMMLVLHEPRHSRAVLETRLRAAKPEFQAEVAELMPLAEAADGADVPDGDVGCPRTRARQRAASGPHRRGQDRCPRRVRAMSAS